MRKTPTIIRHIDLIILSTGIECGVAAVSFPAKSCIHRCMYIASHKTSDTNSNLVKIYSNYVSLSRFTIVNLIIIVTLASYYNNIMLIFDCASQWFHNGCSMF